MVFGLSGDLRDQKRRELWTKRRYQWVKEGRKGRGMEGFLRLGSNRELVPSSPLTFCRSILSLNWSRHFCLVDNAVPLCNFSILWCLFFIWNNEWDQYTEIQIMVRLRGENDDILMAVSGTESHHVRGVGHLRITEGRSIARIARVHRHGWIERRPCNYNFRSLFTREKGGILSLSDCVKLRKKMDLP